MHNLCFDHGDAPAYSRTRHDDEEHALDLDDDVDGLDHDEEDENNEAQTDGDLLQAGRAFRQQCPPKFTKRL
ncbi:hypothetical protein FRC06_008360 [Ceratobasidium sp. 370]|nr:hypothetical protein FRC06_008360 [Ceratobasidium sp. 370]